MKRAPDKAGLSPVAAGLWVYYFSHYYERGESDLADNSKEWRRGPLRNRHRLRPVTTITSHWPSVGGRDAWHPLMIFATACIDSITYFSCSNNIHSRALSLSHPSLAGFKPPPMTLPEWTNQCGRFLIPAPD